MKRQLMRLLGVWGDLQTLHVYSIRRVVNLLDIMAPRKHYTNPRLRTEKIFDTRAKSDVGRPDGTQR